MRLFFDANTLTYIALFDGFLAEGTKDELEEGIRFYERFNHVAPNPQIKKEILALRALYCIDDQARFDWLCSDIAFGEIDRIKDQFKRSAHRSIVESIIEHRHDVYESEGRTVSIPERARLADRLFPSLPPKMRNDALQFCEAEMVEAYFFITNDLPFINKTKKVTAHVQALRASDLPFVAKLGPLEEVLGLASYDESESEG